MRWFVYPGISSFACFSSFYILPCSEDPGVFHLMSIWGKEAEHRWPTGVIWFASFLIFLGTSYGTKKTYRSSINSLNRIWALLNIPSPLGKKRCYPKRQVDVFLALATMALSKAASTCRVAKCAAEDEWLLNGNNGSKMINSWIDLIFKIMIS